MNIHRFNDETNRSWVGFFVFFLAVALTGWIFLFYPTAFSNDGRVISAFIGFLAIGNGAATYMTQKKISLFCVVVALISIVWFFLAGIQGSVFQLHDLIKTFLMFLLMDSV